MSITTLRMSIIESLRGKANKKTYTTIATMISSIRPRVAIQVMAIGKDNRQMLPKHTLHVITLTETISPVNILYAEGILYVLE
jgi:hypothetical protein